MQALYWWIFVFLALVFAIECGRRLSQVLDLRNASETRDTVKQATGIVATLTALVLGLLIANGQKSFEQQGNAIAQIAVDAAHLDETLSQYGDAAQPVRMELRNSIGPVLYALWDGSGEADLSASSRTRNEAFLRKLIDLPDDTPGRKMLKDQAYDIANKLVAERFQLAMLEKSKVPGILLATLTGWTLIVFAGLGICSDHRMISRIALYLGAASAATAMYLVIEYQTPFSGSIQISRAPVDILSAALAGR